MPGGIHVTIRAGQGRSLRPILLILLWLAAPASAAEGTGAALKPTIVPQNDDLRYDGVTDFSPARQSLESAETLRRRLAAELEPFKPLGIKRGPILYFPSLAVEGVVTDNVRDAHRNRIADTGLMLAPAFRIETDWLRHAFRFEASGERIFYTSETDYDPTAADARALLRLDFRDSTELEFDAAYDLTQASAGSDEVPQSAVGLRLDQSVGGGITLERSIGHLGLRARAGALAQIYGKVQLADGATEDNADRNYIEPALSLRTAYGRKPGLKPYMQLDYLPRLHFEPVDRNGERRSSQGLAVSLGATIDDAPLWTGDLALRYEHRVYVDPSLAPASVLGLQGTLLWRPRDATTVALTASSGLAETAIVGESADPTQGASLGVTQTIRQDLAATAIVGVGRSGGGSDAELTWNASLDLVWALARAAELVAGYELTLFDSADPQSGFIENRVHAGLRLRL